MQQCNFVAQREGKNMTSSPINHLERTSIYALANYIAFESNLCEEVVLDIVASKFGVEKIGDIRRDNYDDAIRYLVDLNSKEIFN